MKEMKNDENTVGLISTAIGAVLAMAVGTGLSILLNGFVRGFLALTAVSAILACVGMWKARNPRGGAPPIIGKSGGARG
jgi:hypothetical protein